MSAFIARGRHRLSQPISTYARGLDGLWGMYQWLEPRPKGRNEAGGTGYAIATNMVITSGALTAAAPDITALREWLINGAPSAKTPDAVLTEMLRRTARNRYSALARGALPCAPLHPQILGRRIQWRQRVPA